jgi:nucleoid-associated protein YgaU
MGNDGPDGSESVISATSDTEVAVQRVIVKEGDTLEKLARRIYGRSDERILEMIQKNNPEITDLDLIHSGQILLFAPVEEPGR